MEQQEVGEERDEGHGAVVVLENEELVVPLVPGEPFGRADGQDRADDALDADQNEDKLVDLPLQVTHLHLPCL